MVMLRALGKLQKCFSYFTSKGFDHHVETMVPNDVKEGQFAVFAINGEEIERFVIELSYLTNPEFVKLLKLAEEEFGFEQDGALAIPCSPQELHRVLGIQSF